ncbi:MAG TPA: hypothetical protein VLW50_01020 [Streptosporangiaceae bacterium]|nr:hypothetical protein [Streptosporangiaceae bacterium]
MPSGRTAPRTVLPSMAMCHGPFLDAEEQEHSGCGVAGVVQPGQVGPPGQVKGVEALAGRVGVDTQVAARHARGWRCAAGRAGPRTAGTPR